MMIEQDEANIWQAWAWAVALQEWEALLGGVEVSAEYYLMRGRANEAIGRFQQTLDQMPQQAHQSSLQGTLLIYQAKCQRKLGNLDKAIQLSQQGERLVTTLYTRIIAALVHGTAANQQGHREQARQILTTALDQIRDHSMFRLEAHLMWPLGDIATYKKELEAAQMWLTKALSSARQAGDVTAQAWIWLNLGHLADRTTQIEQAHRNYQRAAALFQQHGIKDGELATHVAIGYIAYRHDQFVEARPYFVFAKRAYQNRANIAGEGRMLIYLGVIALYLGELHLSIERLDESIVLFQKIGHSLEVVAHLYIARAYVRAPNPSAALSHLNRLQQLNDQTAHKEWLAPASIVYGDIALARGELQQAMGFYQQAQAQAEQLGRATTVVDALTGMGHIHLLNKQFHQAMPVVEQICTYFENVISAKELFTPARTQWIIYQTLKHHDDPRAESVRRDGIGRIEAQMTTLGTAVAQSRYIENIPFVAEWLAIRDHQGATHLLD